MSTISDAEHPIQLQHLHHLERLIACACDDQVAAECLDALEERHDRAHSRAVDPRELPEVDGDVRWSITNDPLEGLA
jgi:hypothetical protein